MSSLMLKLFLDTVSLYINSKQLFHYGLFVAFVLSVPTMIFYNNRGEQLTASQLGDTMTRGNLQKALASLS